MGFYDERCMVTGVSLKGSRAALVLLQSNQHRHQPIALAITGQYDRLGSIDMIDEDANTELILRYFLDQLATGNFAVDAEYLRVSKAYPIETIEQLLRGFERNMNDGVAARLAGEPVEFALIAATIWKAIAGAGKAAGDHRETFRGLFDAEPVPSQIYGEGLENLSRQLREFAAVSHFLTERNIPWAPATDGYQHYGEEMRQFLDEARTAFRDSPPILQALRQYELEIADLLED